MEINSYLFYPFMPDALMPSFSPYLLPLCFALSLTLSLNLMLCPFYPYAWSLALLPYDALPLPFMLLLFPSFIFPQETCRKNVPTSVSLLYPSDPVPKPVFACRRSPILTLREWWGWYSVAPNKQWVIKTILSSKKRIKKKELGRRKAQGEKNLIMNHEGILKG